MLDGLVEADVLFQIFIMMVKAQDSRHSKSNVRKSEQIEFNRTNRTQSNSIRLIVFD